jgi:hypothetical protein
MPPTGILTKKTKFSLATVPNPESSIQTGKLPPELNYMIVLHNLIDDSPSSFQS